MKTKILVCEHCGKNFAVTMSCIGSGNAQFKRKYCSIKCKREHWKESKINKIKKICPICGKEFYVAPCNAHRGHTCSRKCGYEFRKQKTRAKADALPIKNCITCGKPFKIKSKDSTQKFCSFKCCNKKPRDEKICPVCKKPFEQIVDDGTNKRGRRTYCSKKCQSAAQSNGMIKINSSGRAGYRIDLNDGNYYLSCFEADYARYLNLIGKKFVYCYKTFEIKIKGNKITHYTPDFYLVDEGKFIELKGYVKGRNNAKHIPKLKSQGINIELIKMKKFYKFLSENNIIIPNLENGNRESKKLIIGKQDLLKINKIEKIDYDGDVIDIEVEDDASFFISNKNNFILSHNSKSPDADTDIEDERRQDVRDYLAKKWGETCIAPIVALSRYSANSLFRDVCKQYDLTFSDYNPIAKTIDVEGDEYHKQKTFKQNLEENKDLQNFINKLGDKGVEIADIVGKLEGQTKNISIAAAGTIISNKPLKNIMPLRRTKEDKIITEWEGHKLEPAGYLKMDLLGLKTLTVIRKCLTAIGKDINFIYNLPFDDEKVYENFRAGKTEAIFQFEGKNITKVLTKIKPTELEHLSITSSLYRPGPIESGVIQHYLDRRNGIEPIEYMHPIFEDILKPTLGLVIYQEQVIDIYAKLGLTYGEGDLLRRYCEQKNKDKMEFYYNKIKSSNVLPKDELDKLMPVIEERIGYSFNRSHSIQYAIVSYWGMWLKTYYPEIFCTVNLNQNLEKHEKIAKYIDMTEKECGIHVDYCDFNSLSSTFNIELKNNSKVMNFGYLCVKNISEESLFKINEYTKKHKPTTLKQILDDSDIHKIKKNVIETLIQVGAMDEFPVFDDIKLNRSQMIKFYERYIETCSMTKKELKNDEFFMGDKSKMFTKEYLDRHNIFEIKGSIKELIKQEFDLMGHCPMINIIFEKNKTQISNAKVMFGDNCRIGYIAEVAERNDKKKNKMCFLKVVDENGVMTKCTIFSGLYSKVKSELEQFALCVAVGKYSEQWNSLTVDKVIVL